ncbi:MAG: hypothetical protein WC301_03040 [Candidatus Omnitrophota bacterium]
MKKSPANNIILSAAAFSAVLLCLELLFRVFWGMGGWVERPIYRRSADPYLRYEFVPGAKTAAISINSDGFRGPEYPVKKPAGTFRIIMLGDSETFSFMLSEKDSLPAQLETLLNQDPLPVKYEVLNFGVEGYSTLQELEMFKKKGMKYEPDLIILNYVLNDPEPGEYYFNKSFLMRHSALVRYFSYRVKKAMIRRERRKLNIHNEIDNYYYYHRPQYFKHVKEAIYELAGISRERGNRLAVVVFPTSSVMVKDFKENYPYWPMHEMVKNIRSKNIVFIDLIDEFNRLGMTPEDVSINYKYDESHKNPRALGVSARYIYGILKSNGLIGEYGN